VIDFFSNYFFLFLFSRCDKALPATDLLAELVLLSLSTFEAGYLSTCCFFLPLVDRIS
jgi:hypothetical protein